MNLKFHLFFLFSALLLPGLLAVETDRRKADSSTGSWKMQGENGIISWRSADRTELEWIKTPDHIDEGKALLCRNPKTDRPHKEFIRSTPIPFSAGTSYRISGYIRTDRPGRIFLTPYGASSGKAIQTNGKWQRLSMEFKAVGKNGKQTFFLILSTLNGKKEASIQELTIKDFSITRKE